MSPELTFHQTGSAFFWTGFLLVSAAGSCALLLALLFFLQSATPDLLGRAAGSLRERPLLSLGLGVGVTGGLVALVSAGRIVPAAGACGVALLAAFGLFGLAAASETLGRRIAWISGREGTRASHLVVGWVVLFAASCVPFIGWFIVLPWGLAGGIGALAHAAATRKPLS